MLIAKFCINFTSWGCHTHFSHIPASLDTKHPNTNFMAVVAAMSLKTIRKQPWKCALLQQVQAQSMSSISGDLPYIQKCSLKKIVQCWTSFQYLSAHF